MSFDTEHIVAESIDLTNEIARICAGRPTAAVYLAIANTLGNIERHAGCPDRPALLKLISEGMDDFIRANPLRRRRQ